jgi:hypothetical protein
MQKNNVLAKYTILNLVLLAVSTVVTILILSQWVTLLTEELIIGMFIVPVLSFVIGLVVALVAWVTRISKKFAYVLPMAAAAFLVGWLIVFVGPDWVRNHLTHDQIYGHTEQIDHATTTHTETFAAPGLDEDAMYQELPTNQQLTVRDVQPIANQSSVYWVLMNRADQTNIVDCIAAFDQKNGHKLSALKSVDDIWADVQRQQQVTLGKYAMDQVQWNLKDGEVVLMAAKDRATEYQVYLKSDGKNVTIDHIVDKKK